MAIDREHEEYIPVCDICGEPLFPCDTFNEAEKSMKDQGWTAKKIEGHYEHYCTECQ